MCPSWEDSPEAFLNSSSSTPYPHPGHCARGIHRRAGAGKHSALLLWRSFASYLSCSYVCLFIWQQWKEFNRCDWNMEQLWSPVSYQATPLPGTLFPPFLMWSWEGGVPASTYLWRVSNWNECGRNYIPGRKKEGQRGIILYSLTADLRSLCRLCLKWQVRPFLL